MKMRWFYWCVSILLFYGCNNVDRFYIYSSDKNKCLTIFNSNKVRFIVEGRHLSVPDSNYIKLDVSRIPEVSDCLHVSWGSNIDKIEIVVAKSRIIISKLDTTKFRFDTALPLDEFGYPTEIKFREEGTAIFSFYSMSLSPDEGAIVEY